MDAALHVEIEDLRRMSVGQLKQKYVQLFGEESRSNHKEFLFRRLAWRLQALAYGDITERARKRALEIANDADLRVVGPKDFLRDAADDAEDRQERTAVAPVKSGKDRRLPVAGTILTRIFRGKTFAVKLLRNGFEYDGRFYRSLNGLRRKSPAPAGMGSSSSTPARRRGAAVRNGRNGSQTAVEQAKPAAVRCAIYTRKSTEEGLSQEFNSLDAQREAAEAYVASQRHEGWVALANRYDDGGFTGGNMDRPALKRLLDDVDAGEVDCVVVYKVDRLSRSLLDFARIMESFDKRGVSFVSVTQQFNTTASLGRLTLNILLSFAQFERELISERTRDKASAARKKGKWIGGHPVLGYDIDPRGGRLMVNEKEARRVREISRCASEVRPRPRQSSDTMGTSLACSVRSAAACNARIGT